MASIVLLLCNRLVTNADEGHFNAEWWLRRFGYLSQASRQMSTMQSSQILPNAVSDMQRFYGLELTGEMDPATLKAMRRPRCGVPDKSVEQAENGVRRKRYALTGQKWDKNLLTYSIMNTTPKVGEVWTLEAIRRAFEVWERVTPLSFEDVAFQDITNSSQDTLDIMLLFASGFHGDMSLFEGEWGSPAHAYYPGSGMGGDTHFDADEPWTLDNHGPSAYTYFYKGSKYWRFDNQKMKDDPDYPISPAWTQIQMTQLQAASGQQWTSQNHNHQLAQSRMRWTERPIRITPTMWIRNLMRRTKGWMWW